MGKIKVEFRGNTRTGKRDVIIHYESDESLTFREHRDRHWQVVDQLLALDLIKKEQIGEIIIRTAEGDTVLGPRQPETERPPGVTEKN